MKLSHSLTPLRDVITNSIINMKIKSSDTFFPTKFRPTTANTNPDKHGMESGNTRSYKLVKKRSSTQESSTSAINPYQSVNIFKATELSMGQFNYQKDRPVGGIDLFLKEQNKKNKVSSTQRLSHRLGSPDSRKKELDKEPKNMNFLQNSNIGRISEREEKEPQQQQIFKSHHPYQPPGSIKNNSMVQEKSKNQPPVNIGSKVSQHNNWVDKQTQNFQNKMSVLNEVYYKKPLVEKYGDRYFQYFLRNRYEDDFPPPVYIHQIRSDVQARNANNDKFICKVKKIHPNIKNFEKLVVKGKQFSNTTFPETSLEM